MCNVQRELREFMAEHLPLPYNDAKPLCVAPKPVSSRLFMQMSTAATAVYQKWQGRGVRVAIEVGLHLGYACNSVIALAEAIASFAAAVLLTQVHISLHRYTDFFETHMIQAWSYSVHALLIIINQLYCSLIRHPMLHSAYSVLSNCSHLAASALCTGVVRQDNWEAIIVDSLNTFVESKPLVELLSALDRDFGEGATKEELQELLAKQSIIQFFSINEVYADFIDEFEPFHIIEPEFRAQVKEMAKQFVHFSYHPAPYVEVTVTKDSGQDEMDPYRKKLVEYVKTAFETLKEQFSNDDIEAFDPSVIVPIAKYAELLEIQDEEVHCPKRFSERLQKDHAKRREDIMDARKLYNKLKDKDHFSSVVKRGLGLLDNEEKELMGKLEKLATSLYAGKLMTQPMETQYAFSDYHHCRHFFQEALVPIKR